MKVARIDELEQLDAARASWDRLYSADPAAQVFCSWPWFRGWAGGTADHWFVLAAHPDGGSEYAALLPLSMERHGALDLVRDLNKGGNLGAYYSGFLCDPRHQEDALPSLSRAIQAEPAWDRFRVTEAVDERWRRVLSAFPAERFVLREETPTPCFSVELPGSWDDYLEHSVGRRGRRNLRRAFREVQPDRYRFSVADQGNPAGHTAAFLTVFQLRWGELTDAELLEFRSIFYHCAAAGLLWLGVLWDSETPVAAMVGLIDRSKGVFYNYLTGFDARYARLSPGWAMNGYAIQYAIARGLRVYDIAGRDYGEGYKSQLGGRVRPGTNVTIVRKQLRSRLGVAASSLAWRVRHALVKQA